MPYLNGATGQGTAVCSISTPANPVTAREAQISPEGQRNIRELLTAPFDTSEIKWRVTATSTQQTKHGPQKRGQLIAYADQRAYTDRLNEVFGEWGWTRDYDVQVAQNFERRTTGDKTQTAIAAKVVVVSKVTIHGLGSHTGVGEEWADDENAATRAEAQAFKRACACFGLGRYLYDLDKTWVDLDEHNRPLRTPSLPEWATPRLSGRRSPQEDDHKTTTNGRQSLVRDEILAKISELQRKVGHSLSHFVLQTQAGGQDPRKLGHAKLTAVFEKLADLGNGIDRLRKAATGIGDARYSAICREVNLPSDSIDDIPDRHALKVLIERVEAEALEHAQTGTTLAQARGQLLQEARRAADRTRKRLADVIAEASDGALSLEGLKSLTEADVQLVATVIKRIVGK